MPDLVMKKIKDNNPSGETKWTTKGGTYITTGEANIWFQLTEFAPSCLFKHTSSKSTAMPRAHPTTSFLDAMQ
jgi:hypothetical protein